MPHYRYTAEARLTDGTWHIKVEGFPGIVEECDQASVPDAARHHVANNLGVPAEHVTVSVQYWQPPTDETWRDRTENYPKGEHPIICRVFQGGDVLEAVTELHNWFAANVDLFGSQTENAGIEPISAVFAFDLHHRRGDAPVEISLYYEELEHINRHALTVASAVVAELLGLGIAAQITKDSTADRAVIAPTAHPGFQFAFDTSHIEQPWAAENTEGEIDSPLDDLTYHSTPHEVADAIQEVLTPHQT
jgi:hypothetical protein